MGFKAIWWLGSAIGEHNRYDGKVWDYQPVWGTGSAIVELTPAPNKELDFEKEFDEGPAGGAVEQAGSGDQGTGLESHNVLPAGPDVRRASEMSSQDEEGASDSGAPPPTFTPSFTNPTPAARENERPDVIRTERAAPPVGPYPHARRVGNLLFLSGIGPRRPGTGEIPGIIRDSAGSVIDHDIEVQTRAVIDNVRAILEEAGSSLDKVLDVTVYLTDMKRDFETFNRIYAEYLGKVQPTRTTVGVDSLPTPIAVELKIIAAV
jgi:2-aminomuconate deaminase